MPTQDQLPAGELVAALDVLHGLGISHQTRGLHVDLAVSHDQDAVHSQALTGSPGDPAAVSISSGRRS